MVRMQIKCNEGNILKRISLPRSQWYKETTRSTKGNGSVFPPLVQCRRTSMSHRTARVITCALSSPAARRHQFDKGLVDLSNTTFSGEQNSAGYGISRGLCACRSLNGPKVSCCGGYKAHKPLATGWRPH